MENTGHSFALCMPRALAPMFLIIDSAPTAALLVIAGRARHRHGDKARADPVRVPVRPSQAGAPEPVRGRLVLLGAFVLLQKRGGAQQYLTAG